MTKNVMAIPPSMTLHELGALFENHDYNCFPVVEGDVCVGIVTKFDFLRRSCSRRPSLCRIIRS